MALRYQRKLGNSELSYFLPSRGDGVNDMYLHLGFRAPTWLVNPHRVVLAWAILRNRHPLLASKVDMPPGKYEEARFIYSPPVSSEAAIESASTTFLFCEDTKDALIDSYLNGPRTLSNDCLSFLILSRPSGELLTPPTTPATELSNDFSFEQVEEIQEFNFLICAVHFLGDGMALHTFANDLFNLLAAVNENRKVLENEELQAILESEWQNRWQAMQARDSKDTDILPPSLESRLPKTISKFQQLAQAAEFRCSQQRIIGGHAFPKAVTQPGRKRHTIVPTVAFDKETTKRILGKCKAEGVSVSHVLFALCNVSWSRLAKENFELPMMMYSALNLRPYLPPPKPSTSFLTKSYWFLAVGYFNVILPCFQSDSPRLLWHRAQLAKQQCLCAAKTPFLLSRTRHMAEERGMQARTFAALDDAPVVVTPPPMPPTPSTTPDPSIFLAPRKSSSTALLGLSLLGNLDATYKHASYPDIQLHTLITGSRQRAGGLLVFGYTFAGKLWISLGYDEGAFSKEVKEWWQRVIDGVNELSL